MGRVVVWLRQALRRRRAVSALPEEAEIAFAVRLKHHALAVRRPDGYTIAASQRETPHGPCARHVVDPHIDVLAIVGAEGDPLAVWRQTRVLVRARRKLQRRNRPVSIDQREV